MFTLEQIRKRLELVNIQAFALFAGVHPNSLYKIRDGQQNASYATVKKLSDALIKFGEHE